METNSATNPESHSVSRRYYWINLAGISLGTICLNTGYNVFFFTMSALHSQGGLGSTALAINYVTQVLTGIFLPPFLMKTIGCKWTLVVSGVSIAIFIATNLKPSFETLVPGALIGGIGYSTMFATMNTVVSDLAVGYATLTASSQEATLKKFFSLLCGCFTMANIWANLISTEMLPSHVPSADNISLPQHLCGAHYCDIEESFASDLNSSHQHSHTSSPPQSDINNLAAASLGFDGIGIILILTLLNSYNPKATQNTESSLHRLLSAIRLLREPNLIFLILFTINTGLMYSFLTADYAEGFVTCSLGIHYVGLVAMCFGTIMSLGTFLVGYVATFIPRIILFLIAVLLNITDLLLMLFWTPDPQSPAMFYIIAAIWGSTYTIWLSQLCALYGDVFPSHHQEAYSNHRTWYSLGFAIGFAWSYYLCMSIKIFMIMGLLIAGTVGYLIVEIRIKKGRENQANLKEG